MNAAESGARTALNLYRRLMRYGQQLKLTDTAYYNRRVRKEFRRNRSESDPAKIQFQLMVRQISQIPPSDIRAWIKMTHIFQKGEALLNNRRVL